MRCYHLCNYYLSGIQAGIQSAHAQMELFVKYSDPTSDQYKTLFDWASNHKTMICLNGGNAAQLTKIMYMLTDLELKRNPSNLIWAPFWEDTQSLNGCITNIALIIPPHVYNKSNDLDITQSNETNWLLRNLIQDAKLMS